MEGVRKMKKFDLEKSDIESYMQTLYYQKMSSSLNSLVLKGILNLEQKDSIVDYKAKEYKIYVTNEISFELHFILKNYPDLLDITDYFIDSTIIKKYIFVVSKSIETEFEEILKSDDLEMTKQIIIFNEREFIAYFGYLKKHFLNEDPFSATVKKAEQAGFSVGVYSYSGKNEKEVGILNRKTTRFSFNQSSKDERPSSNGGYRKDMGSSFKSSWEANIARILKFLNIKWEYEYFHIVTLNSVYVPDFYYSREGDEIIIEVKGRWDNRSIEKVSYVLREEPDYTLFIVDADIYNFLEKRYNFIEGWEDTGRITQDFIVPVVGVNISDRKKYINNLDNGEEVEIITEPKNPYDHFAIKVINKHGQELGYIKKEWAAIITWKINFGFKYDVFVYDKVVKGSSFKLKFKAIMNEVVEKAITHNLEIYYLTGR